MSLLRGLLPPEALLAELVLTAANYYTHGRKPAIEANRSRIQVWLYEQVNMRIEGCIIGFDEYMNLVLDDAEEVHMKTKNRKPLGRIMLKGDNITLLQSVTN
ncbi:small nuclear ribonucleoprotein E [Xenentodon cancila]